jgi:hypothetical protein
MRDTSFSSSTCAVLYESPVAQGGFSAGVMHSCTRVDDASLNQIQRLGGIFIRQFEGQILGIARPSVTGLVWRYMDDPSKRGEWAAAMAIGFSLNRK